MAESFRDYLRQRWEAGQRHGRTLFAEIQKLGYRGSYSHLAKLLSPWRQPKAANAAPPLQAKPAATLSALPVGRQISPQVAAALMSKNPTELSGPQAEIVAALKKQCPDLRGDAESGFELWDGSAKRKGGDAASLDGGSE